MAVERFELKFDLEFKHSPEVFAWNVATAVLPTTRNK
jgi:hypothetical protein